MAIVSTNSELEKIATGVYAMQDVSDLMPLLLRFNTLTVYVIEPYISQNEGEPIKIPAGDNYSILDYGGRLQVVPNDIYAISLFVTQPFLSACEQLLLMLIDIAAMEIAILGDQRAKNFMWERCERAKTEKKAFINITNFTPQHEFVFTSEAVLNYLRQHGMEPKKFPSLQTNR